MALLVLLSILGYLLAGALTGMGEALINRSDSDKDAVVRGAVTAAAFWPLYIVFMVICALVAGYVSLLRWCATPKIERAQARVEKERKALAAAEAASAEADRQLEQAAGSPYWLGWARREN